MVMKKHHFVEIERIFDEHDFDYEGDLTLTGTNNKRSYSGLIGIRKL